MKIFKIWEILLCLAVALLGAIAYESHKFNSQRRYVMVNNNPWELLDTSTGNFWTRKYPIETIIGDDTSYVYKWNMFTRGPEPESKPDTVKAFNN